MVSDTIGDFIIRLKNAGMVGKTSVSVPYSKLKHVIADRLAEAGYIGEVKKEGKGVQEKLIITLKYIDGRHAIGGVKRLSSPGRRLYIKVADIHRVKFGMGHMILSTPAGILTDEAARKANVGGEQLFTIW